MRPKKYSAGAIVVPITPIINKLAIKLLEIVKFLKEFLNKEYEIVVKEAKKASVAVSRMKECDFNRNLPKTTSIAHIAPAQTPNSIPTLCFESKYPNLHIK